MLAVRAGGSSKVTGNIYIRQVNGVKLADILFSLLCVCLSACVSVRTQSSLQHCVSLPQRTSHGKCETGKCRTGKFGNRKRMERHVWLNLILPREAL